MPQTSKSIEGKSFGDGLPQNLGSQLSTIIEISFVQVEMIRYWSVYSTIARKIIKHVLNGSNNLTKYKYT